MIEIVCEVEIGYGDIGDPPIFEFLVENVYLLGE